MSAFITKLSYISIYLAILTLPMSSLSAIGDTLELEEITVTARKSEIRLQDAAVAVSVTTGEDFERSNISKLDNFNGYTPGLVVAKNDGAGRVVAIRGVGWETAQNIASQPSVLTYIDGLYLANPLSMGLDLGELERVEVFRGPQGTEFGQGTTGGAINLVTKKPVLNETTGYTELGLGTYNTVNVRAALNIPLGENSALRGSIQNHTRDGYAEIKGGVLDGYELDDADSQTARLAFLWEPSDSLSVLVQGFAHRSDQNAAAQKNIDDPNPDPRELTQDYPGIFNLDNQSASLTLEWEAPNGLVVKSLTGYQKLEKEQSVDGDRLTEATISVDLLGFYNPANWDVLSYWDNNSKAFSQEINVTSKGDTLDWLIGGYYLDHENFNDFLEVTGGAPYSASLAAVENPSLATLPPFQSVLNFTEARTVSRKDVAMYGQATYRITENLAITAGVRWQDEEQNDAGQQFFGLFGPFSRDTNESATTWKIGADLNLTDDHMVYAQISTGWKNGGTNPAAVNGQSMMLPVDFKPEEVTSFEVGSRNTLLDGRARFNITAFYYDHENLQYIFEDPVPHGGGTNTIPNIQEMGIETEFNIQLSESWRLDGMLSWQDGKVKDDLFALDIVSFRDALSPGVGHYTDAGFGTKMGLMAGNNLKGNEPAKMPDIMARIGITNTHEFSENGTLSSKIELIHRGEMYARIFNNPLYDRVPSYDIVNISFSYDMVASPLTFGLIISNVTDEDGVNNIFNNPFGIWSTSNEYIPPREVIASIKFRW